MTEESNIYYTELGMEDRLDGRGNPVCDSPEKALAKTTVRQQTYYYVKISHDGKLYNPKGLFSEGSHAKFLSKLGKPQWRFVKVSSKVFDMYLNFLKTKNVAWLNNAQREMN